MQEDKVKKPNHRPEKSPLSIITELSGFWLFYIEDYGSVIKTERQRFQCLANIVVRGVKGRIKKPLPSAKQFNLFGAEVESLYHIHMGKIAHGVQMQERAVQRRLEMLDKTEIY
jgi:hypothetical protein